MMKDDWEYDLAVRRYQQVRVPEAEETGNWIFAFPPEPPMKGPDTTMVVGGPLGYYGTCWDKAYWGPRRDTIEEARIDALDALEILQQAGDIGLLLTKQNGMVHA